MFLQALKAPRYGDTPPRHVDALEACSDEVLSLVPRPLPRDMLHTLMANRARVVGVDNQGSGSEVHPLGPEEDTAGASSTEPAESAPNAKQKGSTAATQAKKAGLTRKETALRNMHQIWELAREKGAERDVKLYMLYLEGLGRLGDLDGLQQVWTEFAQDEVCAAIYRREECKGDGE